MTDTVKENALQKILIVEDDLDQQRLMRLVLEDAGYIVFRALFGQAALRYARTAAPDLILLDIMLAESMDGWEVMAQLRAHSETAHIPVIVVTVLDADTDLKRGRVMGAVDYLKKPFTTDELLLRVQRALSAQSTTAHEQEPVQGDADQNDELAGKP